MQVFVANAWICACACQATDRDLESFSVNAWICALATDRDRESVFVKRKMNARICACQSTDRDLESVFNMNAWICACQTTDRDLETCQVPFLFKTVTTVTSVTSVIFLRIYCFRIIINL